MAPGRVREGDGSFKIIEGCDVINGLSLTYWTVFDPPSKPRGILWLLSHPCVKLSKGLNPRLDVHRRDVRKIRRSL